MGNEQRLAGRLKALNALAVTLKARAEAERLKLPKDDVKVFAEKEYLKHDKLKLKLRALENKLDRAADTHDLRREYVPKLYSIILGWIILVGAVITLTAYSSDAINNPDCQINCTRFKLGDNVMIAFITSTTATVLGLFYTVAKWLYPSVDSNADKSKKPSDK